MATPTSKDSNDMGQIEHEIAQVREDLGRTVHELGARLTPAHLMDQAKRSLRDSTKETTRAMAQTAGDVAAGVASRTREAALEARDRVQAHPYTVGAIGAGLGLGYWVMTSAMRDRRRLVTPREWDEPFDRSSRRRTQGRSDGFLMRALPVAAAAIGAWLIYRGRE